MGIFDSLQNIVDGVVDSAQGSIGDIISIAGEIPGTQEVQDAIGGATESISSATDGATDAFSSIAEQGQAAIEDFTNNLGL